MVGLLEMLMAADPMEMEKYSFCLPGQQIGMLNSNFMRYNKQW
jgi:hypothetical protein